MLLDDYWNAYSAMSPVATARKQFRKAPKSADQVLDAPNLINDFCKTDLSVFLHQNYCFFLWTDLNLLSWSKQDMVSIALGPAVYVFSGSKGDVHQLCDLGSRYVTSVQWSRSGKYLAVGTSDAQVQASFWEGVLKGGIFAGGGG